MELCKRKLGKAGSDNSLLTGTGVSGKKSSRGRLEERKISKTVEDRSELFRQDQKTPSWFDAVRNDNG